MRYIIYTRVSKNRQTVENQLKECREYVYKITQKGDEVIEFSEPDTSTRKPMLKRKKLMEMMAKLRSGDQLVVYKVDRLARDPQELINIYCDIRRAGIDIYGLHDPNLTTETICIYAFIAASERKNTQIRTVSALNLKKANMERVGATWYGYRLDETQLSTRESAKSYGKPYRLLPNDDEQKNLGTMIELCSQGLSCQDITNELARRGVVNRAGNPFQKMSVYRILMRMGKIQRSPKALAIGSRR